MKSIFISLLMLMLTQSVFAQGIRRSTLSSIGSLQQAGDIKISSSFGQTCIGCSTLQSPDGIGYLRQGYQQPNFNESPCGFASSIAVEPLETPCGTYYNFEYLGNTSSDDVIFQWNFGPNASPSTSTEQNPSSVAFAETGVFMVSVSVSITDVCFESVSANLAVDQTGFGAMVNKTDVDCFGETNGSIILDYFGGTPPYTVTWNDDANAGRIRENLLAGEYFYTIEDSNGCTFESSVIIVGPDGALVINPVNVVPESCTDAQDGSIEIEVIGGAEGYDIEWSTQESGLRIDNLSAGDYDVTVTDINGCVASMAFNILNICEDGEAALYDVISPNGDGINDTWTIPGIENYPENIVRIHNRWGDVVWNTRNYTNDGGANTFQGQNNNAQDLPTGAYFYVIEFNDTNKTILGGAVTVVR